MNDYREVDEILSRLCGEPGTSGAEDGVAQLLKCILSKYADVSRDPLGNVIARMGEGKGGPQILLDAHMDQIGLIVTGIDDRGFLRVGPCGGIDARVLPGSRVTVCGTEPVTGIVCTTPPHLRDGDEREVPAVDRLCIDVGMSGEAARAMISLGDSVVIPAPYRRMLGTRVTGAALDNRAGCAAVIRCAQLLHEAGHAFPLTILFSGREETGRQGAAAAAYSNTPDACIVVDVSFAVQPGVPESVASGLGAGPMIGVSAALDRDMFWSLVELAKREALPYQVEATGETTGTNADLIGVARGGVRCALISVPQRNMHTPAEIVDLADIEHAARLMAAYVVERNRG